MLLRRLIKVSTAPILSHRPLITMYVFNLNPPTFLALFFLHTQTIDTRIIYRTGH